MTKNLRCMDGVESYKLTEKGMMTRIKLVNKTGEEIEFKDVGDWLSTLASAMGRGWEPNGDSNSYVNPGRIISKEESSMIADALGKVARAFQENSRNLGTLIEFLKKGEIHIEIERQEHHQ